MAIEYRGDRNDFYRLICPTKYSTLREYAKSFSMNLQNHGAILTISKLYIVRLIRNNNINKREISELDFFTLMTVAIIIACKYVNDENHKMKDLALASSRILLRYNIKGLEFDDLMDIELDFLSFMKWDCHVSKEDYEGVDCIIEKLYEEILGNTCDDRPNT